MRTLATTLFAQIRTHRDARRSSASVGCDVQVDDNPVMKTTRMALLRACEIRGSVRWPAASV